MGYVVDTALDLAGDRGDDGDELADKVAVAADGRVPCVDVVAADDGEQGVELEVDGGVLGDWGEGEEGGGEWLCWRGVGAEDAADEGEGGGVEEVGHFCGRWGLELKR